MFQDFSFSYKKMGEIKKSLEKTYFNSIAAHDRQMLRYSKVWTQEIKTLKSMWGTNKEVPEFVPIIAKPITVKMYTWASNYTGILSPLFKNRILGSNENYSENIEE